MYSEDIEYTIISIEMVQCVKALATKSDSLSSTPGTQVKEENCLHVVL